MALKLDSVNVLVPLRIDQLIDRLYTIFNDMRVDYADDRKGQRNEKSADIEIVVGGSWGEKTVGAFWEIDIDATDLGDGRTVINLLAKGESAAKKGLRAVLLIGLENADIRGYSLAAGIKARTKIITALGAQILPENEEECNRILMTGKRNTFSEERKSNQILASWVDVKNYIAEEYTYEETEEDLLWLFVDLEDEKSQKIYLQQIRMDDGQELINFASPIGVCPVGLLQQALIYTASSIIGGLSVDDGEEKNLLWVKNACRLDAISIDELEDNIGSIVYIANDIKVNVLGSEGVA